MSAEKLVSDLKSHRTVGVRCYDNGGKTFDRYTVVFTGRYRKQTGGEQFYRGMSEHPCHPQGFGLCATSRHNIDLPAYSHLGKKVKFADLPIDCQGVVLSDAIDLALD